MGGSSSCELKPHSRSGVAVGASSTQQSSSSRHQSSHLQSSSSSSSSNSENNNNNNNNNNTRYPFSMKFIVSLERLINQKRNNLLQRECGLTDCRPNQIFYLNAILDLQEILNRFDNHQRSLPALQRRSLKPQMIYDYLFTINKIKLDLENFPKQFNSNKLYQQLYQFCAPINLNSFIDLYDINEIKIYVSKEANQQIKEYSFNAYFTIPLSTDTHPMLLSELIATRNRQQQLRALDAHSISSQSTTFE